MLRLGRNAAEFRIEDATTEELVAAITGASDNVVSQRAAARSEHERGSSDEHRDIRPRTSRAPTRPLRPCRPTCPTSG